MFFDPSMSAQGGHFCHGAVGIPDDRYEALLRGLRPVLEEYRAAIGDGNAELKATVFARLDLIQRRSLASRIAAELEKHGGFVAAFFTPVRSYVLEHVRTALLGVQDSVPPNHLDLYQAAVKKIRNTSAGPGQSTIILELLWKAVGCTATTLASLGCPYEVTYDPRDPREDRTVRAGVEQYLSLLEKAKGRELDDMIPTDISEGFLGVRHDRASHEEIGLQLADLVAGESVRFFRAHPELMEFQANRWLVTQTSFEAVSTVIASGQQLWKNGTWYQMPVSLRNMFHAPDAGGLTIFEAFTPLLASGGITCYSSWGQPRQLMPFLEGIWDQID